MAAKLGKVLAEYSYKPGKVERGYAGRTLYVNISERRFEEKPVTDEMKDKFTGGRGFDLWLMWQAIPGPIDWRDPLNEICIASGPLGGTTFYSGSGKSIVTSISPTTQSVIDSNVGGHFGPLLKFAGFDALEVQGKSENEVVVFVDGVNSKIQIISAGNLPSDSHVLAEELTSLLSGEEGERSISVVSAGSAADHALIGCLNFSWFDPKRGMTRQKQAGRGGTGSVFRDKKLRAIVVKHPGVKADSNAPADAGRVREWGASLAKEIRELDDQQCKMRTVGTVHLVEIMDEFDLLPVHNYKFGQHADTPKISSPVYEKLFRQDTFDGCWYGCMMACCKAVDDFVPKTGPYKGQKVLVDGPEYETVGGGSNMGLFDPHAIVEYNFYCDTYGIDTISFSTGTAFAMECYENGILDKDKTGGLELKFGNAEAALELLHQMSRGEGFGVVVGQGIRKMKEKFIKDFGADPKFVNDIGMEAKGLEYSEYVTKESLAMQGGYGLALKGPQHDEAWLIFMDMVHNLIPTFEDKAEALHWFPMWRTWFGLNGLCKLPWNDVEPADNAEQSEPAKVPKHVLGYTHYFSGVTGREVTEQDLITMSERVYNFQRCFNVKMGFGTREHDRIPYRSAGPVTVEEYESRADRYDKQLKEKGILDPEGKSTGEKMAALRAYREEQYDKLCTAVYARRGWDNNGIPTVEKLKELGIDFPSVVEVVEKARGK